MAPVHGLSFPRASITAQGITLAVPSGVMVYGQREEDKVKRFVLATLLALAAAAVESAEVGCGEESLEVQARGALRKAVGFFANKVATNGGYLWRYSADLTQREGEGKATPTQVWVQPPGTPAVGQALLGAYRATGETRYLQAACAAADALIWGQLACGGWQYSIDFDPTESRECYYRRDLLAGIPKREDQRDQGTFDDDTTQSATCFLIAIAEASREQPHRDAAEYALDFILRAQFENGAWPQRYPLSESGYSRYYTFNDRAINDCIATMLEAWRAWGHERYSQSALRGGDFIIASQLAPPQAGWAQQYDWDMNPAWARKFEPPAVCAADTSSNIRTLVDLYLETGVTRYLEPIPAAIAWLEQSQIAPGRWARFYELGTNRPLYFNRKYELVYTADNLPTHYSFQGSYGVKENVQYYERVRSMGRDAYLAQQSRPLSAEEKQRNLAELEPRVREILAALDEQGRWLESDGWIHSKTFIRNVGVLSHYLALAAAAAPAGASG